LEWAILASIVAVISPALAVLITYVRTWSKFDVTIANLAKIVDKLAKVMESIQLEQQSIVQRISKEEAYFQMLEKRVTILENRINSYRGN
jgi:hypothetical protein